MCEHVLAKPCSFCGKRPHLVYNTVKSVYVLGCVNNFCVARPQTTAIDDYLSEVEAEVKRWNKRTKIKETQEC